MKISIYFSFFLLLSIENIAQVSIANLDSIAQEHHLKNGFEGVILVTQNGMPLYYEAFGFADFWNKESLHKGDIFKIASLTKKFTAIRIMQLYGAGHLGLNSSIISFLPDFDIRGGDEITVRDLLMHTSGLPKENDSDYLLYDDARKLLYEVLNRSDDYQQKGNFRYNNVDYILLGMIIENITGSSWQENIRSHILDPLNMTHTGFFSMKDQPVSLVKGQIFGSNKIPEKEPFYNLQNYFSAGAMYSNAKEILSLDQALYSEKILGKSLQDIMYTSDASLGYVALGCWVYKYPFLDSMPEIIERRGGLPGFNHVWIRIPERRIAIIILSNTDKFDPDTFGDKSSLKEALIIEAGK